MKTLVKILFIVVFGYIASLYLPFWSVAAVAFVGSLLIRTSATSSFFSGFLAIFLVWSALAYMIDQETGSLLTDRVAQIFMGIPGIALVIITGVIGGLVAGLGSASGALLVELAGRKRQRKYY